MAKRERISSTASIVLTGTALFVDFIKILLFPVGWLIAILSCIAYWSVYTLFFKIDLLERVLVRIGLFFVLSWVPLFGTTIATRALIWTVRKDDERYNEANPV